MTEDDSLWFTRLVNSAEILGISESTVELILMVGAMGLIPIGVLLIGKVLEEFVL
jgi:hypothetical protein